MFEGFERRRVRVAAGEINLVLGGSGPPLLLLHGYPQTHVMWHRIAPDLARAFTVVCPDLRGYGDSLKPRGGGDHAAYSKRAMAQDQVEAMQALGFARFAVAGHDRGGRVAHRLALDHDERVERLAVLDICPTYAMYADTDKEFATAYYHWFFLIQKAPLPETLLARQVPHYVLGRIGRGPGGIRVFDRNALKEYVRAFRDPRTIHATCEDYRAAATIDLVHDKKDLKSKIKMPVLVLWGKKGVIEAMFRPLSDWREVARDVRGRSLDCGHFLPEEAPEDVLHELRRFLGSCGN